MGRRKEDRKKTGKIRSSWVGMGGRLEVRWKASRRLLEAVWGVEYAGVGDRESGACKVGNGDLAGEEGKRKKRKMRGVTPSWGW